MVNTIMCHGGINRDTPTEISHYDIMHIAEDMHSKINQSVFCTSVQGIFCLVPPKIVVMLFTMKNFVNSSDYHKVAAEREIGSMYGIRFVSADVEVSQEKSKNGGVTYDLPVVAINIDKYDFDEAFLRDAFKNPHLPRVVIKTSLGVG